MNINASYEQNFYNHKRRDFKEIDNKHFSQSETVDDVKAGFKKEQSVSATSDASYADPKMSDKAKDYLAKLRKEYGNFDIFIGNTKEDIASLSKRGNNEFSVIFSNAELERMARDEKYAAEKMQGVQGAVKMCKRICEENGYASAFDGKKGINGTITKIGVEINDYGTMKLFAELEKTSGKQRERIEKNRERNYGDKKAEAHKKNPYKRYEKDEKDIVKRTMVTADSENNLMKKIRGIDWNNIKGSSSGDRFNYFA